MGLHKSFDRGFFLLDGAVATSGGSLTLVKGQLAVIDTCESDANGLKVLNSFLGRPKDLQTLAFRLGVDERQVTRSYSNKSNSSVEFALQDIVSLKVSAPKKTELTVDEVILGYNGINPATSLSFESGETPKTISLELYGDAISYLGGNSIKENIDITLEIPRCEPFNDCITCDPCGAVDCKEITLTAIEQLKKYQLPGGTLVEDIVDITPVFECDTPAALTETPYAFYCIEVCDLGTDGDLARVQKNYPDLAVKRVERNGAISKYQVLRPQADGLPADLVIEGGALIKGCAACDAPAVEVPGGFAYSVLIEDDGVDVAATIAAWVGADTGAAVLSAIKVEGQEFGKGAYTVIFDLAISDLDIAGFVALAAPANTATITNIGEVAALCQFPDEAPISWVECGVCNVIEECYLIDLPDNECGDDRLVELQNSYKDLTISLEGTAAGCQTRYKTVVISNLVCDECDPIFKDIYETEAPEAFEGREWFADPANAEKIGTDNCKCGIRFKARPFTIKSDECLRDRLGFVETAVMIRVAGGQPNEVREGIGKISQDIYHVEYVSRYSPRTHLGGNLQDIEENDRKYFTGNSRHDDYLARVLRGDTSSIEDQCVQYVDYSITVRPGRGAQGFAARTAENITYHFYAEVGKHKAVEDLLNKLGAAAGVGTVQAFGA